MHNIIDIGMTHIYSISAALQQFAACKCERIFKFDSATDSHLTHGCDVWKWGKKCRNISFQLYSKRWNDVPWMSTEDDTRNSVDNILYWVLEAVDNENDKNAFARMFSKKGTLSTSGKSFSNEWTDNLNAIWRSEMERIRHSSNWKLLEIHFLLKVTNIGPVTAPISMLNERKGERMYLLCSHPVVYCSRCHRNLCASSKNGQDLCDEWQWSTHSMENSLNSLHCPIAFIRFRRGERPIFFARRQTHLHLCHFDFSLTCTGRTFWFCMPKINFSININQSMAQLVQTHRIISCCVLCVCLCRCRCRCRCCQIIII